MNPHIFIGGEIGCHQVGMEAREAQNRPDREKADHKLYSSAGGEGVKDSNRN